MAYMCALGDWLDGSGWIDIFQKANINTPGRIESFLKGSNVKRSRYAHQVSLSSLVAISRKAFESQEEIASYDDWKNEQRKKSINAQFWFTVIEMEILLFMFVRSLRQADFDLFVRSLRDIIPWMFALDHVHYARWLPVFLEDLLALPSEQRHTFECFLKGYFTIKKSNRDFSNIGIDQAHEQNNKLVKIDGGAIGILENESALITWAVSGPVIADILQNLDGNDFVLLHHENTDAFEKSFQKDKTAFTNAFLEFGNPFLEEEGELVHIISKYILDKKATTSVKCAKEIGQQQYNSFVCERLHEKTSSMYDNIKKNNFQLFRQKNSIVTSKSKQKIVNINSDRRLYASLYVACQSRQGDLGNFFSHENHAYPVSISEYGKLRKCSAKSDFLKCLEDLAEPCYEHPSVDMMVIDGAAFVNINQPKSSKTFGEYCDVEIKKKVEILANKVQRLDLVFDTYIPNSIKSETRESRGYGIRISVRKETPVHKKFQEFMRQDDNKTELFKMLANTVRDINSPAIIVATNENGIVTNSSLSNFTNLQPCNQEEADTRLLLHTFDGASKGYKKVLIVTVDTDVVVIALYHFFSLNIDELWVEMGVGQYRRWLPIHTYANLLKEEICRALPFWFAVTGCDTVSMFAGRGKKTCWSVWKAYPEATQSFVRYKTFNFEILPLYSS